MQTDSDEAPPDEAPPSHVISSGFQITLARLLGAWAVRHTLESVRQALLVPVSALGQKAWC